LEFNFFELLADQAENNSMGIVMEDEVAYRGPKTDKQKQKGQLQNLSKQLKQAQKEIVYLKKINGLLEKKKDTLTIPKKKELKKK
jgi:hypothetical protein